MVRLASIILNRPGGTAIDTDADRGDEEVILAAELPSNQGYVRLSSIAQDAREFLALGSLGGLDKAKALLASPEARPGGSLHVATADCRSCPPIDGSLVRKFICIGLNYRDHCKESGMPVPEEPVVFSKFGSSIIGPGDVIVLDEGLTKKLDFEVELGIIIGTKVPRHTKESDAMKYIGGYTVVHDVSARDWQLEKNGGQWLLGKCIDGFAPIGPVIVTKDEIPDVDNLSIRCRLNGDTVQNSMTSQMVFQCDALVAFLSRFMTLLPGDIIATGTPPGVGLGRDPPLWLKDGDVVECEIDGIGTLSNPIVDASK